MKNYGVAIALALFVGGVGIHKFYVGRIGFGFLYLIFAWTFVPAILGVIDALRWVLMGEERFHARYSR